ncbi:MAG: hypothetical protein C0410_11955 [Anaerolinea sp.]|nr:hypothetical protein [Anaerolinea sp.]
MQRVILVVSPDTEFLQQLRSHLEEGGRYQVTVALSAHEALNLANSNFFEVAIVDGELDDIQVAAFTRDLAALQSELKILVFPPDNNSQHPVLEGLVVNGFLTKPFSGQEIGKALTSLFSDQPMAGIVQVKVVDDLVKQWLQIPETGGRKAEQILESTTAQTVLIIIKDQLIASAGSINEGMTNNVTGFLSRYWKEEENSELARFLKLDGDGSDRFLYATKLVSNVVLVLVYPMNATIQLVRRELNNVKDDFQQHYPTTGELRQDIAKQTLAEINARNKNLESLQPNSTTISQNELDMLKLQQQEPQKSYTRAISQEEIDLLKALQTEPAPPAVSAMSQTELDARKLFEQESLKLKPITTNGISQEEIDMLKALEDETPQPAANEVSQAELEARRLFEQESVKPKPTTNPISQEEIDMLKALEDETPRPTADAVSQAELDARKLFEQESLKQKPPTTSAISQDDINALIKAQQEASQSAANAVSQAELDARKLFEQESLKQKPPTTSGISQDDINALIKSQQEASQSAANAVSQAELDARKLFEQESLKLKPPTTTGIAQEEIDALKTLQQEPTKTTATGVAQYELDALQLFHQESLKPTTVAHSAISEQELAELSKLLEQMPAPDPQPETAASVEEKKVPEWVNELESAENSVQSAESGAPQPLTTAESAPTGIPPFAGIDENTKTTADVTAVAEPASITSAASIAAAPSEPLPEIDFKLPWEMEETTTEVVSEIPPVPSVEPAAEPVIVQPIPQAQPIEPVAAPTVEPVAEQTISPTQPVVEAPIEALQSIPASFAEVLSAVTPQTESVPAPTTTLADVQPVATAAAATVLVDEPAAPPAPPSLKEFRFNYTCVLLPGDREQFLARDLSEKLSTTMPDIHEDQGWRMTSITIRPQYLLWSVAVPMGVCPNQIMHEVRNLTSNLIFAKFPEIAKKKTSNDFWSSKFLAVSGSEPPPANLIFEFVSNAWKNPETGTP